jgi:2-hydroxymuconate-semialdehyde hydrolase
MRRARVSGGELAYLDEGEGPPVVLLHGFPLSSFMWREFMPVLSSRFHVIAPDLLGAGASDKPADAPLDIAAQAGYVRELLDTLGVDRFAAIGHGVGGGIAQLLAREGSLDAMVLLDAVAFDAWPSPPTRDLQATTPDQRTPEIVRAVMRSEFDLGMGYPARLSDDMFGMYASPWEGEAGVEAFFRWVGSLDGAGLEDAASWLADAGFPVLILWGEDDTFQPVASAERLNDAIPTSTLGLLPGCGHFVTEDAPETIAPMIYEYLRARYLKEPHGHASEGIVTIQLERRPPWVDLAEYEEDDRLSGDDEEDDE